MVDSGITKSSIQHWVILGSRSQCWHSTECITSTNGGSCFWQSWVFAGGRATIYGQWLPNSGESESTTFLRFKLCTKECYCFRVSPQLQSTNLRLEGTGARLDNVWLLQETVNKSFSIYQACKTHLVQPAVLRKRTNALSQIPDESVPTIKH